MFEILVLISAYLVVKIVVDIVSNRKCPSVEELVDFRDRKIRKDGERGRQISRHLGSCEECQHKITSW